MPALQLKAIQKAARLQKRKANESAKSISDLQNQIVIL